MQKDKLIGRRAEQQILLNALQSGAPEMVAVVGRRRVGKTFLIKQTYGAQIVFEMSGLQHANTAGQLQHFAIQFASAAKSETPAKAPQNWLEAFFMLANFLDKQGYTEKKVVFFDELPWLAGPKSGFLMGLGWFWNSWASNRDMVVVICGSAASWMIQKVVNDRGGLHNRITKRVFLYPFTLAETEIYLKSRYIGFDRYQIAQIYMAMGGIPHYLKEIEPGKSAIQNINDLCFSQNGPLRDEFQRLYPALFANSEHHVSVVRTLAQTRQGMSRQAIVEKGRLPEGGNTSKVLEELEQSGFITTYYAFDKRKKDILYRLTDEYSLFYLRFIESHKNEGNDIWQHLSQTQSVKAWNGYAYENLCLKHIPQIKKALGISGIYSRAATFFQKGTAQEEGAQIDLLLDRNDRIINLIEIKFYHAELTMTESEAKALRNKTWVFKAATDTKKYLMPVLITTFGMKHNIHSLGLVEKVLLLDDLFAEI